MLKERILGSFADEPSLLAAIRLAKTRGLVIDDVFAPYPIHGLDELMGLARSRLPYITLLGALTGMITAIALQVYTAVVDWPLDVGGKPANSALAFVPITFELTVLCAGLFSAGAFLWRSRLFPGASVRLPAPGVTGSSFVLVLDPVAGHADAARQVLVEAGAHQVHIAGGGR
ncbi:MAG TPA: DUF3341 domain-containing protein [Thermoanaerobaculia bacterium]|nr:DUF3341 domain-containing protein [Thermoanaerobaculia bacterium]